MSEVFSEALHDYMAEDFLCNMDDIRRYALTRNPHGYTEEDILRLIKEFRAEMAAEEEAALKTAKGLLIVVIDTNVWVSGLQFGRPGAATYESLERAKQHDTAAISEDLEAEIYRILGLNFLWTRRRVREALAVVLKRQIRVALGHNVHLCRDPKDDMFLECAALANASVLATGDKDLLSLGSYGGTRIVTPLEYVSLDLV